MAVDLNYTGDESVFIKNKPCLARCGSTLTPSTQALGWGGQRQVDLWSTELHRETLS